MSDAALGVTVMWTADPEGRLTFASSNLEELTGHPLSHFSGAGWNEVIHPEDLDRFRTEKQAILDDPRPFQVNIRFETPAGTLDIAAAGSPIYNAAGIVLGYVGTWTDVTRCRNKSSRMPRLEVPSRLQPKVRAIPVVSFDMDGTLCNTYQCWLDLATELDPTRVYDWHGVSCNQKCGACRSAFCLSKEDHSGPRQIPRARMTQIKETALATPDYYTMIEPFDPEDIELIKYCIEGQRFLGGFLATRPYPTSEKGDYALDVDAQSLAWLEGSWAGQDTRDSYAITGYRGTCFSARDKVRELIHRGVQYHIDDNAGTVEHMRAAGIEAFLIDRPWNRHEECAWRVRSIQQFLDIVAPECSEVSEIAGENVYAQLYYP